MKKIYSTAENIQSLLEIWVPKFLEMKEDQITKKRNSQNRNIKQILGHMLDSVSNNTHRIVHLQYCNGLLEYPNYATQGNNDRWIAIQNYENEIWEDLVQLWKYANKHFIHVIKNVNSDRLTYKWNSESEYGNISLYNLIIDFLEHFKLHLREIEELLN